MSEFDSMPDRRDVEMVLTLWPDTITHNVINEFKAETPIASHLVTGAVACVSSYCFSLEEIAASWLTEWKNKTFAELEVELVKRSHDVKRSFFKPKCLRSYIVDRMDALNFNGLVKPQWLYEQLQQGYKGFNYQYTEGETFLNYNDIIRMWGLAKFLIVSHSHHSKL